MTKTFPKKLSNITQNSRSRTNNYEIIRHFDPSERNATCCVDLQAPIPQINANIDNEANTPNPIRRPASKPLKVSTPVKRKTVIAIPNSYCANIPVQSLVGAQSQIPHEERRNIPTRAFNPRFKSSSSSSVDVGVEKFNNKAKSKSKSFHAGQSKDLDEPRKLVKSSIEKGIRSAHLKSITDPSLLQRELNLKSLKQEILDNKLSTAVEQRRPTSCTGYSPKVQKLKDEIAKSKKNSLLHKKIFITELKTEIAQYKRFNRYQVYTHSGSSPNRESGQSSRDSVPKNTRKTSIPTNNTESGRESGRSSSQELNSVVNDSHMLKSDHRGNSPNALRTNSPQRSPLGEASNSKRKSKNDSEDIKNIDTRTNRRSSNSTHGSSPNNGLINSHRISPTSSLRSSSPNQLRSSSPNPLRSSSPNPYRPSSANPLRSTSPNKLPKSPRRLSLCDDSKCRKKSKNGAEDFDSQKKSVASKQGYRQSRSLSVEKEKSQTGTERETTDERPSESTIDKTRSCNSYSDTDSIDDTKIRSKILEANELIDRVKRALDKMKTKDKKRLQNALQKVDISDTSSTDIEQTIKKLKKDTEKLITGDFEDLKPEPELKRPTTKRSVREAKDKSQEYRPQSAKKKDKKDAKMASRSSPNTCCVKKDQHTVSSDEFAEDSVPAKIPKSKLVSECCRHMKLSMERPRTRRNEAEDELPEDLILDKFRNLPEEGQLVVNSSLEELQAKLQTISESTESMSTPRTKKSVDQVIGLILPKDHKSCACNTDQPGTEIKETQVDTEKVSVEISCQCLSASRSVQANWRPKKILSSSKTGVESVFPSKKSLNATHLEPYHISTKKLEKLSSQTMPVVEVVPSQAITKCIRCRIALNEENMEGISIASKHTKLNKLTIQMLPPISIDQRMAVKQVLNFFITPEGQTHNLLKHKDNVNFIVMESSHVDAKITFSQLHNHSSGNVSHSSSEEEDEGKKITNVNSAEVPVSPNMSLSNTNSSQYDDGKASQFFLKLRDDAIKNLDLADELVDDAGNERDLDEETQQKILVYKSYNLYDNPNRHEPVGLDAKSVERIQGIDVDFYKTFVNPTGKVSEYDMPFRSKSRIMAGFESKEVQCGPSIMLPPQLDDKESTKSLDKPGTSTSGKRPIYKSSVKTLPESRLGIQIKAPSDEDAVKESQVTILDFNLLEPAALPQSTKSESEVPKASDQPPVEHLMRHSGQQKSDSSTPSEITVTISYSNSSEGSANTKNVKQDESQEVEIKSTILESKFKSPEPKITLENNKEPDPKKHTFGSEPQVEMTDLDQNGKTLESDHKRLTVKDKDMILKLQEKLKTVDPNSSDPKLTVQKEALRRETFDFIKGLTRMSTRPTEEETQGTSQDNDNKNSPTNSQNINYHLIDTNMQPKHLVIAKNGRYKDEENLFAQTPHPKPSSQQRRSESPKRIVENVDKEVQSNKLEVQSPEINSHALDTTNSDTVTTNSLSEGEIRCQHSVSNGEIHICKHGNPMYPKPRRNILRSNLTINPSLSPRRAPPAQRLVLPRSNLTNSSNPMRYTTTQRNFLANTLTTVSKSPHRHYGTNPRKFDLLDPTLTIEKRRNYFNNWVTYYVKSQELIESSTSSCSQNK